MNNFGVLPTHDSAWLMMLDSTGFPIYYKMFHQMISNFTLQKETGTLTYWNWHDTTYYEMDSSYRIINSYRAKSGYITNGHELRLKADGSYWIMADDPQIVDMSKIIEGGDTAAIVIGLIIQHISDSGNVLFQWRSWNHFEITDADTNIINLRGQNIDYVHGNALDFDSDTTILLSSRSMNEITKINTNTGNIVWRWGGKHNEFLCINDTIPFLAQHHIQYLGNDIYSLFDDGIETVRPWSRALVFLMSETNKTTTLLNNMQKSNDFTRVMGSNQKLPNGNHLVGWALNLQSNVLSEFNANGDIVYEMKSEDSLGLISYRALKYNWQTNIFYFDADSLDFGKLIFVGDSSEQTANIYNNSESILTLNDYYFTDTVFSLKTEMPVVIAPHEWKTVNIIFKPDTTKQYSAVLSLLHSTDTTRFGQQIRLTGGGLITGTQPITTLQKEFIIYPVPANNRFTIRLFHPEKSLIVKIITIDGKEMINSAIINSNNLSINTSRWQNGLYIVKIISQNKMFSKLFCVKH